MGTEQPTKPDVLASDQHSMPETITQTEAKEHPSAPKSPAKTTDEEQSPKAQHTKEPKEAKEPSDKSDMEIDLLSVQSVPEQTSTEEKVSPQNLEKPSHEDKPQAEPEKSEQHEKPKSPQEEKEIQESKESEKAETGVLHEGEEIEGPDGTKFRILKVNVKNLEASQVHCISCDRKIQKKSIKSHITTKTHKMHVQ